MYLPAHFAEDRAEVLQALMREHPFATLVSKSGDSLAADHLPLQLSAEGTCLHGHVARANPLWRNAADSDVLAIFHGPQAYVTPSWYETKRADGKAVPTWNYVVVHARGRLRAIDDPAWLREQLETLVDRHESPLPEPWHIADAPSDYIGKMLAAIVGIEIAISDVSGKWKVSQNQPGVNRAGVVAGLRGQASDDSRAIAELVAGIPPR